MSPLVKFFLKLLTQPLWQTYEDFEHLRLDAWNWEIECQKWKLAAIEYKERYLENMPLLTRIDKLKQVINEYRKVATTGISFRFMCDYCGYDVHEPKAPELRFENGIGRQVCGLCLAHVDEPVHSVSQVRPLRQAIA